MSELNPDRSRLFTPEQAAAFERAAATAERVLRSMERAFIEFGEKTAKAARDA